jgi:GAF domain-containing protein
MLACDLAECRTSLVSLVDVDRNWFSGRENFEAVDQCRASSFCTHVVAQDGGSLWISDARQDPQFAENPLVTGAPHIRFYAGSPIIVLGEIVGAFCVFDPDPKAYDPLLAARLNRLARIVATDLTTLHRYMTVPRVESTG